MYWNLCFKIERHHSNFNLYNQVNSLLKFWLPKRVFHKSFKLIRRQKLEENMIKKSHDKKIIQNKRYYTVCIIRLTKNIFLFIKFVIQYNKYAYIIINRKKLIDFFKCLLSHPPIVEICHQSIIENIVILRTNVLLK